MKHDHRHAALRGKHQYIGVRAKSVRAGLPQRQTWAALLLGSVFAPAPVVAVTAMVFAVAVASMAPAPAWADGGKGGMSAGGAAGGAGGISSADNTGGAGGDGSVSADTGGGGGGGAGMGLGGASAGGGSGSGGAGGAHGWVTSSPISSLGAIQGQAGVQGNSGSGSDGGGGGGAGGYGVVYSGQQNDQANGDFTGGAGGAGGNADQGSGGDGGDGGIGLYGNLPAVLNTNMGATGHLTGGAGGAGGNSLSTVNGTGGKGGDGGAGFAAPSFVFVTPNVVTGGAGGAGGNNTAAGGQGGKGGDGGPGFRMDLGGAITLSNPNTIISGGNGGAGGLGADSSRNGQNGAGGAGITGTNMLLIMGAGTVAGGLGGDGVTRADAVTFTAGGMLILSGGTRFIGNVVALAPSVVFALAGSTPQTFDVSSLDRTFLGFRNFQVGTSENTWTLTGTSTTQQDWTIFTGNTLVISSDDNLGSLAGSLTMIGGTLQTTAAITTTRDVRLDVNVNDTFQTDADLTLQGVIWGSGILNKTGTGTLTLTGNNTYTGGTTISNGIVSISDDTNLGANSTVLTMDGGTLQTTAPMTSARSISLNSAGTFQTDAELTLQGVIAGAGVLNKTGTGTLTLTGNNTYTGGTTISNGTVSVSNDNNLGLASNTLTLNAGTLRITNPNYVNIFRPIVLGSQGGSLQIDSIGSQFVVGAVVSGSGSLTKLGPGILFLQKDNTYTGDTIINDGLLSVGSGNLTGSIAGNIVNNAALQFLRRDDTTYAGVISGTGVVEKLNPTVLTLTGDSVYTGLTTISSGTLQIGDGNTTGSLTSDVKISVGTGLAFNRSDDSTYGGAISGSGSVFKTGAGALTLTGNSSNLGAAVEVAAGTLVVDGALGRSGFGSLTVDSGATLAGTGSTGSAVINSGGTLAPGNASHPVGALIVDGDLTLAQGSLLDFGIGAASGSIGVTGASASVTVNGNLTLNGATLDVSNAGAMGPGLYNLFSYGNALVQNNGGLVVGAQSGLIVQVLEGDKRIDLINTAGAPLNIWNGNGLASSSQRGGGDGTWSVSSGNWTDQTGAVGAPMYPQPGFAVFGGAPGMVTVDNGAGAVRVTGLQFASDGYTLTGDTLTLVADAGHPAPVVVSVGDGSAASATWTTTINNVIDGVDGLNKTGDGTLVLTNANTYRGGTTISGGILSISSEDNLSDSADTLTLNGGTLRVTGLSSLARDVVLGSNGGGLAIDNSTQGFILSQPLSGTGGLTKLGDGALFLTGDNTYTGDTTIAAGAVYVGRSGTTGSIAGNVINNGLLGFTRTDDVTFAGNISGTGNVVQQGATLILTGNNTYTGGTRILAGAVQVGNGGNTGSIAGDVDNSGTLAFKRSDMLTYGGVVSGVGALDQRGSGTLVLTGDSTYTGGTTISAGTLQVGDGGATGSFVGDVDNAGTLAFKRSDAYAFGGVISGSGVLRQLGTGVLSLTGDSSAYAGSTEVAAGTLAVDGKLGGSLTVSSGATLAGTGVVGAATIVAVTSGAVTSDTVTIGTGGILAPGNSVTPIGTLTVHGNLTLAQGSAYHVDTDTTSGSTDKVHVTGTANLGGSVVHMGSNTNYAEATSYTILTADQGINGTFGSVSSNLAFLNPSLAYGAHDVTLAMQLKQVPSGSNGDGGTRPIRFADAALNGNQRAVANGLQSLPKSSDLYGRVLNLSNGAPPAVFKALSGESHASTVSTLQGVTDNVVSMSLDHLRANLDAGQMSGPPTAQLGAGDASALPRSAAKPVWAQVFGNWRTLNGGDGVSQVKESDGGLFVGADRGIGNGWRLGGALGYTGSHSSQKDLSSKADVDSYSATIYGGKAFVAGPGKINLTAGTAYTWSDIRSRRNIGVMGLDQTLKANYGASTGQVFTDLGYAVPLNDCVTLEPFVGAAYSDLRTRAFSESGGSAALNGKSNRNDVTTTTLGLRARTTFALNETEGHLHGTVGWRHAFGDVNPDTTLAFNGSQPFTVQGAPIARDAAVLELGADLAMNKNTTIGLSYNGQFGSSNKQNAGSINVNWRF